MKHPKKLMIAIAVLLTMSCSKEDAQISTDHKLFEDVPEGAQAVSLLGKSLFSKPASQKSLDNLTAAKATYDADPMDADNIIWYGRRAAYTGDFRRAIEIFSEGIAKHPEDSRMYRHRGHRYITIREFDRAIADYEIAAKLIEGQEDSIEPDGAPNPLGIPVSSRHSNIWYHLGLSYYLVHDWENALRAYQTGHDLQVNDDNIVSTAHWIYMILRRMGRDKEAEAALVNISKDMNVIENFSYHNLDLFYKGEIPAQTMLDVDPNDPSGASVAYGVANWYYYNGEVDKAYDLMERFMKTDSWGAFGFIAAEVDLSKR